MLIVCSFLAIVCRTTENIFFFLIPTLLMTSFKDVFIEFFEKYKCVKYWVAELTLMMYEYLLKIKYWRDDQPI